jgi:hypothetical protein
MSVLIFRKTTIYFLLFQLAKSDNDWNSKSSQQSPYIWNRSLPSQQSQLSTEYNGRMISQSISNDDQLTSKFLSENISPNLKFIILLRKTNME